MDKSGGKQGQSDREVNGMPERQQAAGSRQGSDLSLQDKLALHQVLDLIELVAQSRINLPLHPPPRNPPPLELPGTGEYQARSKGGAVEQP